MENFTTEHILYFTDPHSGSAYGLLNPATTLEFDGPDGSKDIHSPAMTKWERMIWEQIIVPSMEDFYLQVGSDPVVMVMGGDCIHGNRFISHLHTPKLSEQGKIAKEAFEYMFGRLNIKRVYLAYGTDAHVGIEGDAESWLVPMLDKPNRPVIATPMARIKVGGGVVSIAHHGFYVGEANLRGNAARLQLQRRMNEDMLLTQQRPPCLYLSGHWHRYLHTSHIESLGGEDIESHAIVCPALCVMNGYARQKTKSQPILWTGLVLITITDGKVVNVNRQYIHAIDMRENYGFEENDTPGTLFFKRPNHYTEAETRRYV
jgi:hypothetical protein